MAKNERLTTLLREARDDLDGDLAARVDELLLQHEDDTPPPTPSRSTRAMDKRPRSSFDDIETDSQALDETHVSASVGSNEDLGFLDEDLLGQQGPSPPGYMGRNSQVQWMRTLHRKLKQSEDEPDDLPYAPPGQRQTAVDKRAHALHQRQDRSDSKLPLAECYFYLDKEDIDALDNVMPDAVPPIETAEQLTELYKKAVQSPFRILDDTFFDQLRTYYDMRQRGNAPIVGPRWKAIMNLVFAIGARFSQLIGTNGQVDDRDHLIYMSRAVHFLELEKFKMLICAPDSSIIQANTSTSSPLSHLLTFAGNRAVLLLLSSYWSCQQVCNTKRAIFSSADFFFRAWYMIGTSLRHAQAAGFHLRNEDLSMPLTKKRAMAQTWWALHSIECVLTSITGRPRVVYEKDCTVPLLTALTEGNSRKKKTTAAAFKSQSRSTASASSGTSSQAHTYQEPAENAAVLDTFLDSWINLDIIQHRVLSALYSAGTAIYSWQHTQGEIAALQTKLDQWAREALPYELFDLSNATDPNQPRERLLLYLYYQSVKICVTRPCLCRLDKRIDGQSDESARFNEKTADACIQAALDLVACLPEPTTPRWLYEKGCWWSSVHIRKS
jgi:hypothetical protein